MLSTAIAADAATAQATCDRPESNAKSLELLSTYYQGYCWDHTLTRVEGYSPVLDPNAASL